MLIDSNKSSSHPKQKGFWEAMFHTKVSPWGSWSHFFSQNSPLLFECLKWVISMISLSSHVVVRGLLLDVVNTYSNRNLKYSTAFKAVDICPAHRWHALNDKHESSWCPCQTGDLVGSSNILSLEIQSHLLKKYFDLQTHT